MRAFPTILCPSCGGVLPIDSDEIELGCPSCGAVFLRSGAYLDLLQRQTTLTSDHYSEQWSGKTGFLEFVRKNPSAKKVMPAAKLGWDALFAEIRARAGSQAVSVYDAACGFGGLANELINEFTCARLNYVGADIHEELPTISDLIPAFNQCGVLIRWDISRPLPVAEKFDYVLCRASLHHTPDPALGFSSLCSALKPGGTIAVSVYNKKGICREASDDALRELVSSMSNQDAFNTCRQLTLFGQALQKVLEKVVISEDLPLLGIKSGEYKVQDLIYYHFLKCFFNAEYGEEYSTLVNFDWYHPPYAYRYHFDEIAQWFRSNEIEIVESTSIDVQHYVVGRKKKAN